MNHLIGETGREGVICEGAFELPEVDLFIIPVSPPHAPHHPADHHEMLADELSRLGHAATKNHHGIPHGDPDFFL
jgi:hypothetical protein